LAASTRAEPAQDFLGGRRVTFLGLNQTARNRGVQRLTFLLLELVSFVVDDEIQHGPLREVSGLIDDQPTVANRGADSQAKR
jgi:hypothetical protein